MVSTPAQARPLRTAHMPAKKLVRSLQVCRAASLSAPRILGIRIALHHGKHARLRAPGQHCIHACQIVRTLELHTCLPNGHPLMCTRSALYPRLPNGKNIRSRAPAQHCTHACQMVSTPAQVNPAQNCTHACQMIGTPAHAHPVSTVSTAKW